MLRTIWALSSFLLILIVILQNPKGQAVGNQNQFFGGTRATEDVINRITWALSLTFLFLTILISLSES